MTKASQSKIWIPVLLFLVFLLCLFLLQESHRIRNSDFKNRIISADQEIAVINIRSASGETEWDITINNQDVLNSFRDAITNAGLSKPSSHSGPVGEWILNIQFRSGLESLFFASVHKYEKKDLLLHEGVFQKTENGNQFSKTGRNIRLYDWGGWIIERVPEGLL